MAGEPGLPSIVGRATPFRVGQDPLPGVPSGPRGTGGVDDADSGFVEGLGAAVTPGGAGDVGALPPGAGFVAGAGSGAGVGAVAGAAGSVAGAAGSAAGGVAGAASGG